MQEPLKAITTGWGATNVYENPFDTLFPDYDYLCEELNGRIAFATMQAKDNRPAFADRAPRVRVRSSRTLWGYIRKAGADTKWARSAQKHFVPAFVPGMLGVADPDDDDLFNSVGGPLRKGVNLEFQSCLVLDYDSIARFDQGAFDSLDVESYAYSSYHHFGLKKSKTGELRPQLACFRLVLPLSYPIPGAVWRAANKGTRRESNKQSILRTEVLKHLPKPFHDFDPGSLDIARFFFAFANSELTKTKIAGQTGPMEHFTQRRKAADRITLDARKIHQAVLHEAKLRQTSTLPFQNKGPTQQFDPRFRARVADRLTRLPDVREENRRIPEAWVLKNLPCPSCRNPFVFFYVNNTRKNNLECNHKQTCRWYGSLNTYLNLMGMNR